MSYDERAITFTEKLDRLIGHDAGNTGRHRSGAILNALEVMVEEDDPAADPTALRLLSEALLAQATVSDLDMRKVSTLLEGLNSHVKAR